MRAVDRRNKMRKYFTKIFRPYYGKPSRPTTPRPKPMSLNIEMEERAAVMRERVGVMRETCRHYGEDILNPKRIFSSNHR